MVSRTVHVVLISLMTAAVPTVARGQTAAALEGVKENQAVAVREGDLWSPAVFVKREGRQYLVRYDDGSEEWVTADRLKPSAPAPATPAVPRVPAPGGVRPPVAPPGPATAAAPKRPTSFEIGLILETKVDVEWRLAKIINKRNGWYLIEHARRDGERNWREWVEPWRLRKKETAYDIPTRGILNPKVTQNDGPPADKPDAVPELSDVDDSTSADGTSRHERSVPRPPYPIVEVIADGKPVDVNAQPAKWRVAKPTTAPAAGAPAAFDTLSLPAPRTGRWWRKFGVSGQFAMLDTEFDPYAVPLHVGTIARIDLATRKLTQFSLHPGSEPRALAPSGNRIAATERAKGSASYSPMPRLDIWQFDAGRMTHVLSFKPLGDDGRIVDAVFVDDQMLIIAGRNETSCWNLLDQTQRWRIATREINGFDPVIALTPDRRTIAVATEGGVAVIEAASGQLLGRLDMRAQALTFSADGKKLHGVGHSMFRTWDVATGTLGCTIGLQGNFEGRITAVDSDFVLIGDNLYSLKKRACVWRYNTGAVTGPLAIAGGKAIFLPHVAGRGPAIRAVALPDPLARAAADALPEPVTLFGPGKEVSIEMTMDVAEHVKTEMLTLLTGQLTAAGLKVVPAGAPLRVVARTTPIGTESHDVVVRGGPEGRVETTVQTNRVKHSLTIEHAGTVLWKLEREAGGLITGSIREGDTAQGINDQYARSRTPLTAAVLPTVLGPAVDYERLRQSELTADGLVETPPKVAPPGRPQP